MTTTEEVAEEVRWVPEVDLPTRLRLVRREFGRQRGESLTQGAMAELLGVQKATYQGWEAGTALPRDVVTMAKKLTELTGVEVTWLLGLDVSEGSTALVRIGNRWNVFGPGDDGGTSPFGLPRVGTIRLPKRQAGRVSEEALEAQAGAKQGPKSLSDARSVRETRVGYGGPLHRGCTTEVAIANAA